MSESKLLTPRSRLRVEGIGGELEQNAWRSFSREVAVLAGPDVRLYGEDQVHPGGADDILARAARSEDPVLILPAPLPSVTSVGPGRGHLNRLLVPVDRSSTERRILRPWLRRARMAGLELDHVHALGGESLPVMWEGPGHHASAWWDEFLLRNDVPGGVQVRAGVPDEVLRAAVGPADLVLLCWRGDASDDHATIARRLLDAHVRPVLLVR